MNNSIKNIIGAIEMYGDKLPEGVFASALTPRSEPIKNSWGKAIFNAKGEIINSHRGKVEGRALKNAIAADFGYDIDITTLTQVRQTVIDQVFYNVAPADFMPVDVGTGAWMQEILTYAAFLIGDDFEAGNLDVASNSRLSRVDVGITPIRSPIVNWGKELDYSIIELQQASKSGNWSLIEKLEQSRKMNWDLGIQKIAFLGSASDTRILGLLNQAANSDTDLIQQPISTMNPATFSALVAGILGAYGQNCNYTVMPDVFEIPLFDYLGLSSPVSEDFPFNSKLEYLEKAFRAYVPNFKIRGLAYGDQNFNNLGLNRYALYKSTPDCLTMFIPVNYTTTIAGSLNNFQYQSVGYGQYSGVTLFRTNTMLYFDFAND